MLDFEEILGKEIEKIKQSGKYSVYSDFNLEKHKETFINYFEVIMKEDGSIVYAVPSHQQKLMQIAMDKLGVDMDGLKAMYEEFLFEDYMEWLCKITGALSIWGYPICKTIGIPNDKQSKQIEILNKEGLM